MWFLIAKYHISKKYFKKIWNQFWKYNKGRNVSFLILLQYFVLQIYFSITNTRKLISVYISLELMLRIHFTVSNYRILSYIKLLYIIKHSVDINANEIIAIVNSFTLYAFISNSALDRFLWYTTMIFIYSVNLITLNSLTILV